MNTKLSQAGARRIWLKRVEKLQALIRLIEENKENVDFLRKISKRYFLSMWNTPDCYILSALVPSSMSSMERFFFTGKVSNYIESLTERVVRYIGEANGIPYSEKYNNFRYEYQFHVRMYLSRCP